MYKIKEIIKDGKLFFSVKDIYDIYASKLLLGPFYSYDDYIKDLTKRLAYTKNSLQTVTYVERKDTCNPDYTVTKISVLGIKAKYVCYAIQVMYRNVIYKNDRGLTSRLLDWIFSETKKFSEMISMMPDDDNLKENWHETGKKEEDKNPYNPDNGETGLKACYRGAITITELAHLITGMGFSISGVRLCQWMRDNKYIYYDELKDNRPSSYCIDRGLMMTRHFQVARDNKMIDTVVPVVTERGQYFFLYIFKKLKNEGERLAIQ